MNTPFVESARHAHLAKSIPIPVAGGLLACDQCETIARSITLEQYTTRVDGKSSIGEHLRHCVEHFMMLLEGQNEGLVDYDARRRNIDLEQCPLALVSTLCDISRQLLGLDEASLDKPIHVRVLFVPNTTPVRVTSTLARELGFLSSHTIHHLAIVKMIAHSLGASLPAELGVGHGTLAHHQIRARTHSEA